MKWENVKLGKYVEILSGFAFKSKDFLNCGVPVIKIKNITQEGVTLEDVSYISKELADKNEKYHLNYNDILIALTGSHINQMSSVVGRIARVKYHEDSLLNQRVAKVFAKDSKLCDIDYVYYFLSQDYIKISLASKAGGAANQANISPNDVKSLTVRWPDIETQHRIADILSAYDDLIENNQKQIKLLEEAAQRLYKEWFVDLRFPGHENTKIVDGVPEGWNWCKLEDAIQLDPKVTLTKERMKQFIPMSALSTSSMVLDESQFTETRSNSGSKFQNGDTLLARITPCLENGKTAYGSGIKSDEGAVGSTEYIVMRAKTINSYMVYLLARTDDFRQSAINSMSGSDGRQRVKSDKLKMLDYLHPTSELVEKFENVEEPIFEKIYRLSKQMQQAKQARDLLLPKLMSGEVEV